MGRQLVLAEKPSVGRELARVLGCRRGGEGYLEGDRYVVTWALGHLVTLADPDVYEKKWEKWDMADLPMLPQHRKLVVIPQTARQFRVVQGLMKRSDITGLIIATDAGREGEPRCALDHGQGGLEQACKAALDLVPDRQGHPRRLCRSAPGGGL